MLLLGFPARGTGAGCQNMTSPVKKGKFVNSGSAGSVSNVYFICAKNDHVLVVFAEDGMRQMNYRFPGTQWKAWCMAFERDLRNELAWSSGEMCHFSSSEKERHLGAWRCVFSSESKSKFSHECVSLSY